MASLDLLAKVQQVGAGLVRDGDPNARLTMNRERALQINERSALVDLWMRQGRVWYANNPVIGQPETCSAAGTAVVLTDPTLRYTVPAGAVVVPIHVGFSFASVAAKNNLFHVIANEADSYSSGGDAVLMVPTNAVVQGSGAAEVPKTVEKLHYSDTSIVEAALTRPRLLKSVRSEALADEAVFPSASDFEYNILKGDPMVYLVGPASFLVYLTQETTAAEAEWSMSWAVLDAGAVGR